MGVFVFVSTGQKKALSCSSAHFLHRSSLVHFPTAFSNSFIGHNFFVLLNGNTNRPTCMLRDTLSVLIPLCCKYFRVVCHFCQTRKQIDKCRHYGDSLFPHQQTCVQGWLTFPDSKREAFEFSSLVIVELCVQFRFSHILFNQCNFC